MGVAEEIMALRATEAMDLEERGKAGDARALQKWVLYTAWDKIEKDRTIAPARKVVMFKEILDLVNLTVEYHKPPPAEEVPPAAAEAPARPEMFEVVETAGVKEGKRCGVCFCLFTADGRCDCPPGINHG